MSQERGSRIVQNPAISVMDAELLARFATDREEAAFAALVGRHGPMVLGVCRRVLHDLHAAEDAFQATFLVLARKAGSLRKPESLANWLYGVAYRTALRARNAAFKRQARERQVAAMPAAVREESSRMISDCSWTKSCAACPRNTACRLCCAAWKARPTRRRPGCCTVRAKPWPPAWPGAANACGFGWRGADWLCRRSCWPASFRPARPRLCPPRWPRQRFTPALPSQHMQPRRPVFPQLSFL